MTTDSTISNVADRLVSDGFVLLHRLCSDRFLQQLMDVSQRKIHEVQAALGTRKIGIGSANGYQEIVQRSPGRWDLPISPQEFGVEGPELPWSSLVASVLGADAEHSFSGVVYSDPGSPAQHWHTDSPHVDVTHRPAHALNVLVALHDIPLEMGPTEFARGSHRLTNHLRNTSLVRDRLIYQHADTTPEWLVRNTREPVPECCVNEMAAGSCVVFDDRLMHRGLANQSSDSRYVAYFSYRAHGYAENTHFESARSVYDQQEQSIEDQENCT